MKILFFFIRSKYNINKNINCNLNKNFKYKLFFKLIYINNSINKIHVDAAMQCVILCSDVLITIFIDTIIPIIEINEKNRLSFFCLLSS